MIKSCWFRLNSLRMFDVTLTSAVCSKSRWATWPSAKLTYKIPTSNHAWKCMTIAATSDTRSASGLPKADQKFWALWGAPSKSRRSHDFAKIPPGETPPWFSQARSKPWQVAILFFDPQKLNPAWFQKWTESEKGSRCPKKMEEQNKECNDEPLSFWANSRGSITELADDHCKKLTSVQSSTASPGFGDYQVPLPVSFPTYFKTSMSCQL